MSNVDLANRCANASSVIVESGAVLRKQELLQNIIPCQFAQLHEQRLMHIHDLEFYDVCYNCLGVSIRDMVPDQNIDIAQVLRRLFRKIVDLTNLQSGGIGFINFDGDLARYWHQEKKEDLVRYFREFFLDLNVCTRKGNEKPYVTLNFGLDTSEAGRMVTQTLLDAYLLGDDDHHPFLFPNLVFKLKLGCNYYPTDPNYDLFRKAITVTARRMVPTYFNCDSQYNVGFSSETIGIMGCRTRVAQNCNGREGALNRGNIACVTLNLVQIAWQARHSMKQFDRILLQLMTESKELLLHRFHTLCTKADLSQHYHRAYYLDAESASAEKMFKNGTLSIGFIGLWDALSVLSGKAFACEEDLQKELDHGLHIIKLMRNTVDEFIRQTGMNFSLLASAAEGVTGRFASYDFQQFNGQILPSAKGFYSNSFHVPVEMEMDCFSKIDLEKEFHSLCNGGSITYVEFAEMPSANTEAVEEIIRYAHDEECNYFGVNFPLDVCRQCGFSGRLGDTCPHCGSADIQRLRRVSGYLSLDKSFTEGKKRELAARKSHFNG